MLQFDCANCAALCCVALAFDRSKLFAIDKAAGQACVNLAGQGRCRIHNKLSDKGFGGCVQYDCHGAGQRVVQGMFSGQSWQKHPTLLAPMLEAFRMMRDVHELWLLLDTALKLPLSADEISQQRTFCAELQSDALCSEPALTAFSRGPTPTKIRAFLASLKPRVQARILDKKGK